MSKELGDFLRSRRDRLTPARAGIESFGPRRVPGLRREELAMLAGVSADYYSRVEQGRQKVVSPEVLDALVRALRLDETERAHVHDLAGSGRRRTVAAQTPQQQHPDPGLLRLIVALDHLPVVLLGRRGEVLATNLLLTAVLGRSFLPGESFLRYLFQDPMAREWIVNWADFAAAATGAMRREAGRHPHDRRLHALIDELRRTDVDVARWWDDFGVRDYASVPKHISHPVAGRLSFDIEVVTTPFDPEQRLIVYTAEPGSTTHRLLPMLGSWALT